MPSGRALVDELDKTTDARFRRLNEAFASLVRCQARNVLRWVFDPRSCVGRLLQVDDFSLVKYVPLNATDEDSVALVLAQIDNAIQYGEDIEPRVRCEVLVPWVDIW